MLIDHKIEIREHCITVWLSVLCTGLLQLHSYCSGKMRYNLTQWHNTRTCTQKVSRQ